MLVFMINFLYVLKEIKRNHVCNATYWVIDDVYGFLLGLACDKMNWEGDMIKFLHFYVVIEEHEGCMLCDEIKHARWFNSCILCLYWLCKCCLVLWTMKRTKVLGWFMFKKPWKWVLKTLHAKCLIKCHNESNVF